MPEIQAFHGIRYDLGHVGSLSDVVALPYDVINTELQTQLYEKHPANFVRLELNRIEPGDNEADNRYTRAGRLLKNWRSQGLLFQELLRPSMSTTSSSWSRTAPTRVAVSLPACGFRRSAKDSFFRTKKRCPAQNSIG